MTTEPSQRRLTVVAQDPSVKVAGRILTARIPVPAETLGPGPQGHRVHVIDYDSSTDTLYRPRSDGLERDFLEGASDGQILERPHLHAQNVYTIVMSSVALFEAALGRRVGWGFAQQGHQLKVLPHAFAEANAFYSRRDEALLFGYFPSRRRSRATVFTCLSHDVVAHETTHALLDGLRRRYAEPSSPDQAALHEGFADVVALLSVFRIPEVIEAGLREEREVRSGRVPLRLLTRSRLLNSRLFHLGEEMGEELEPIGRGGLRRSARLDPATVRLDSESWLEPHRRGEVFVAAVVRAFVDVWVRRLERLLAGVRSWATLPLVMEEGARAAEQLLSMSIRAIDYSPPVDVQLGDFLSAMLTADRELVPDDTRYRYREALLRAFGEFGIEPATRDGFWEPPRNRRNRPVSPVYRNCHWEALQRDSDEMNRFLWENRRVFELDPDAYTYVASVRPCRRLGPDGMVLRETVAEYVQILDLQARELRALGIQPPSDMARDHPVRLYGGGILLFDEFGQLKYHVGSGVRSRRRQQARLEYLWEHGGLRERGTPSRRFALLHRTRALAGLLDFREAW